MIQEESGRERNGGMAGRQGIRGKLTKKTMHLLREKIRPFPLEQKLQQNGRPVGEQNAGHDHRDFTVNLDPVKNKDERHQNTQKRQYVSDT